MGNTQSPVEEPVQQRVQTPVQQRVQIPVKSKTRTYMFRVVYADSVEEIEKSKQDFLVLNLRDDELTYQKLIEKLFAKLPSSINKNQYKLLQIIPDKDSYKHYGPEINEYNELIIRGISYLYDEIMPDEDISDIWREFELKIPKLYNDELQMSRTASYFETIERLRKFYNENIPTFNNTVYLMLPKRYKPKKSKDFNYNENMTCFNSGLGDDVKYNDWLNFGESYDEEKKSQSDSSIIIEVQGKQYCVDKLRLFNAYQDHLRYQCTGNFEGMLYFNTNNITDKQKYVKLMSLGIGFDGYMKVNDLYYILYESDDDVYQLKKTAKKLEYVINVDFVDTIPPRKSIVPDIEFGSPNLISGDHCQPGKDGYVYSLMKKRKLSEDVPPSKKTRFSSDKSSKKKKSKKRRN